jgi:prepilin-type processing-associated H-X9-DG protein
MAATNFKDLSNANISYFLSLDAVERYPQMILDGDDNLAVDGVRVKPGILNLWPNSSIAWTKERHRFNGNIGLADGSVVQVTIAGLNRAIADITNGVPTNNVPNRWVFP